MRQNHLLKITEGTRSEFDGGRRRDVLPILSSQPMLGHEADAEVAGVWSDFSLSDSLHMRAYFDLTRSGLKGDDVGSCVLNGMERVRNGRTRPCSEQKIWLNEPRGLFDTWDDEIWIAREVWTCVGIEDITKDRNFSVTWWGGTQEEIQRAVAMENAGIEFPFDHRETLALQFYNLSAARQKVLDAARALNLPELAQIEGGKA